FHLGLPAERSASSSRRLERRLTTVNSDDMSSVPKAISSSGSAHPHMAPHLRPKPARAAQASQTPFCDLPCSALALRIRSPPDAVPPDFPSLRPDRAAMAYIAGRHRSRAARAARDCVILPDLLLSMRLR